MKGKLSWNLVTSLNEEEKKKKKHSTKPSVKSYLVTFTKQYNYIRQ